MLIVISCAIFFITALVLIALNFYQPAERYAWLVAIGGALLGLVSVFLWQTQMNFTFALPLWGTNKVFSTPIAFRADGLAWPYALSLATLAISVLLAAVTTLNLVNAIAWAGSLALTGLGLLAVTADNPLTLLLVWAALDLTELFNQLLAVKGSQNNEKVAFAFATRAVGIGLLIWANVISASNHVSPSFASMSAGAGVYLILAAGLRMGVLPLHLPYSPDSALKRGFGTSLRLVSAASSLAVLARIPSGSLTPALTSILLALALAAGIYSGWMWLRAPDELSGRPYWVISLAALSVASAVSGNSAGAVGWGCALILLGGSLFLASVQHIWVNRALLIGVFSLSTLPFSLTAGAWLTNLGIFFPFIAIAQALIMAGYIRHALRASGRDALETLPAWMKTVYPISIGLLIFDQVLLGLFGWDGARQIGAWLLAVSATLLTFGLFWATPRFRLLNPIRAHQSASAFNWQTGLYGALSNIHRTIDYFLRVINSALEGDGGLMWTLLVLILFISLMTQGGS
ncbi:MAG: hypothetical protein IT311_02610 [Anaerolineales bacterium]|nr:hypothetical protein [Anaerolineales bacterium]MCZ2122117.1 hypothetical protein [Anaerolineales bacterium]